MKRTICIVGHSGSGKTTATKYLRDTFGGAIITGDAFLFDTPKRDPKGFEAIYGHFDTPEQALQISRNGTVEQQKAFFKLILNDLEEYLNLQMQKNKSDNLWLDWVGLAETNIWKNANLKLLIDNDKKARINALIRRGISRGKPTSTNIALVREIAYHDTIEKARITADRIVFNNYDDTFEPKLKAICEELEF